MVPDLVDKIASLFPSKIRRKRPRPKRKLPGSGDGDGNRNHGKEIDFLLPFSPCGPHRNSFARIGWKRAGGLLVKIQKKIGIVFTVLTLCMVSAPCGKASAEPFGVSSASAVVYEPQRGLVLYEKDIHTPAPYG